MTYLGHCGGRGLAGAFDAGAGFVTVNGGGAGTPGTAPSAPASTGFEPHAGPIVTDVVPMPICQPRAFPLWSPAINQWMCVPMERPTELCGDGSAQVYDPMAGRFECPPGAPAAPPEPFATDFGQPARSPIEPRAGVGPVTYSPEVAAVDTEAGFGMLGWVLGFLVASALY